MHCGVSERYGAYYLYMHLRYLIKPFNDCTKVVVANHCGLDCRTGLQDWTDGLDYWRDTSQFPLY